MPTSNSLEDNTPSTGAMVTGDNSEENEMSPGIEALSSAYAVGVDRYVTPGLLDRPHPVEDVPRDPAFLGLVHDTNLYTAILGMLCSGASIKAAFGVAGVLNRQVTNWLAQGVRELSEGRDTYLGRLSTDVYRARSTSKADAEMRVKSNSPNTWLKNDSTGRDWDDRQDTVPLIRAEDHLEQEVVDTSEEEYQTLDDNTVAAMIEAMSKVKAVPSKEVIAKEMKQGA